MTIIFAIDRSLSMFVPYVLTKLDYTILTLFQQGIAAYTLAFNVKKVTYFYCCFLTNNPVSSS